MTPVSTAASLLGFSQLLVAVAAGNCTVSLQLQTSSTPCYGPADSPRHGHFGCSKKNNTMWAGGGCRGYFHCNGQPNVLCGGGFGQTAECPCVSGPPPPPPPPLWPACAVWHDGKCAPPCMALRNETGCAASPYKCVWKNEECSDPLPCVKITDADACAASPYLCKWRDGACNITQCNFNGTWNLTYQFGNPIGKLTGGMHYADMHIFQPPGSQNYTMEWREGHCVLPECDRGRARGWGSMMTNRSLKSHNGTGSFLWGIDNQGFGSASPFPSELDNTPAPDCTLLTFPDSTLFKKVNKWCKKPYCPSDSPTAELWASEEWWASEVAAAAKSPPGGTPTLFV